MTPADLAELLKTTAAAVLAEHDLDASALPATVTVERPRNPEHGDYATNLALQLGKKVGANPRELAGWLATALADADGIASAEVAGPGFVNLRLDASAQGVIVNNVIDAGKNYGHSDALDGHEHQPGVRLRQPDRPDPHRRHPLGRGRRRARPAAVHAGRRRSSGSTTSTTTAPRSTGSPTRWSPPRRASRPPRTATPATTSPTSPPRCSPRSPTR